jgi:hypothetical protein
LPFSSGFDLECQDPADAGGWGGSGEWRRDVGTQSGTGAQKQFSKPMFSFLSQQYSKELSFCWEQLEE